MLRLGCQAIAKLLSFGSLWTNITETWMKLQNFVSHTSLTHIFSRKKLPMAVRHMVVFIPLWTFWKHFKKNYLDIYITVDNTTNLLHETKAPHEGETHLKYVKRIYTIWNCKYTEQWKWNILPGKSNSNSVWYKIDKVLKFSHNRHPMACPWGQYIVNSNYVPLPLMQCCMQYHAILEHLMTVPSPN